MDEMHLRHLGLLTVLASHLLKRKKDLKNLKKQEIQGIFIKMNYLKLAFNMTTRLMEILKICLEEPLPIKY